MSNSQGFYAVSAATALLLTCASYTTYTQLTGAPAPVLAPSCDTYVFGSNGDPHVVSGLDGQQTTTTLNEGQENLETTQNTVGGQTQIATQVTNVDSGHDGNGLIVSNSYNKTITITHAQSGTPDYWQLTTGGTSSVTGTVTDASGTHVVSSKQAVYEPDGTTIEQQNGAIVVVQKLSLGGVATSSITANGSGLDVSTTGNGVAVVNGTAVAQAAGGTNALVNGQTCAQGGAATYSSSTAITSTGSSDAPGTTSM